MNSKRSKGETLKKPQSAVLFTLICVLGLGIAARAQDEGNVLVTVPYDFVAGGAELPAGTYTICRVNTFGAPELLVRSSETGAGGYLIPTAFSHVPAQNAHISLQSIGGKYFLTKIQTSKGVYTIDVPRSTDKLATIAQHEGTSASGGN
jgi:hypothetical protein